MQHGTLLGKCQTLKGMPDGVTQIECLADTLFGGILLHYALLHSHALGYHLLQVWQIGLRKVEAHKLVPMPARADESVLEHLGITRTEVHVVKRSQEARRENHRAGRTEDSYLVLQTAEVDACLAAYTGIHHAEQRGGNVDVRDSALECAGCKTAQVGHHAAAQIDHEAVSGGSSLLQRCPYRHERFDVLVLIGGLDDDVHRSVQALHAGEQRAAKPVGSGVGEHKHSAFVQGKLNF